MFNAGKVLTDAQEEQLVQAEELEINAITVQKTGSDIDSAIKYLEQAHQIRNTILGPDDPKTCRTLIDLGFLYMKKQDFSQAGKILLECYNKSCEIYGMSSKEALKVLDDLGTLYELVGQLEDSLEVKTQALEFVKSAPNMSDEVYGRIHLSYGKTLLQVGRLDEAITYLNEAYRALNQVFSHENQLSLSVYNNLAQAYLRKGAIKNAMTFAMKAKQVCEYLFESQNASETVAVLNTLGQCFDAQGDHKQALENKQLALELTKQIFGERHASVATTLNNIAYSYQKIGNLEEALKFYNRALEIFEEVYGKTHHDYITVLNSIAIFSLAKKDYTNAEKLFSRSVELSQKLNRGYERLKAESLQKLGQTHLLAKNYNDAISCLERALNTYQEAERPVPTELAEIHHLLGLAYSKAGRHQEALNSHKKALEIRTAAFGDSHPQVGTTLYFMGAENLKLEQFGKAEELSKKALDIYLKNYGDGHKTVPKIKQLYNLSSKLASINKK